MSNKSGILSTVFFILSFLFVAAAAPEISHAEDAGGTWHFDYGYDMTFTSGSSFTGTGGAGSSYTWKISNGNISGNQISWSEDYNEITYHVDRTGTINGDTMSGSWTTSWNQSGTFTAVRTAGGTGNGNSDGNGDGDAQGTGEETSNPSSNKRATSIGVFCNRNGVGLSNADCSVTLADRGAPPRMAPTGEVKFVATNGFFPANASCFPQQTLYSPGIVSCKVQFAIPNGFPIGVAFPVDATYMGDSVFAGSSTSHELIQAGCIGDATNPCSGAVALTFADVPQILKNAIATVFECGSSKAAAQVSTRKLFGDIGKCVGTITANMKIADVLSKMDFNQLQKLGDAISNKDAKGDKLLNAIKALDDLKYAEEIQNAINNQVKLGELLNKIQKDQSKEVIDNLRSTRTTARAKKPKTIILGTAAISVKDNSVKPVNIKLTKQAKKLIAALKAAGRGDIETTLTMKGKRAAGPKKPFNKSVTLTTGLN